MSPTLILFATLTVVFEVCGDDRRRFLCIRQLVSELCSLLDRNSVISVMFLGHLLSPLWFDSIVPTDRLVRDYLFLSYPHYVIK
ncbi:unnamed protein product [Dibothriocephalus latus]|uniref:Secreted protein n=1 Tax=Dibothriocephalus latus TaxID=60516 RepID=A0A3P6PMX1_DIBLA|nr:unnamed protein product [Dibothriocephalus latus]